MQTQPKGTQSKLAQWGGLYFHHNELNLSRTKGYQKKHRLKQLKHTEKDLIFYKVTTKNEESRTAQSTHWAKANTLLTQAKRITTT